VVCPYGQIRFYTYNTVEFLLVGAYVIVLIYIREQWVEYKIPLHWKEKNWSGLNDIDVVKWIKKTCTMCK
jgi:hypothetical protein